MYVNQCGTNMEKYLQALTPACAGQLDSELCVPVYEAQQQSCAALNTIRGQQQKALEALTKLQNIYSR